MRQFAEQLQSGDSIEVIRQMLEYLRYRSWLRQTCDMEVAEKRWDSINIMIGWLENARHNDDTDRTISDLVGELILNDMLEQQEEEDKDNVVNLMTLHAAKGLEFPHVFIVGVEEEILPHRNSVAEGDDTEERRLFYVGITRAMKTLFLSYAKKRKRFGDMIDCEPSRFLKELPAEDIEWDIGQPEDPEKQKDTGRAHLANLRAMREKRLNGAR